MNKTRAHLKFLNRNLKHLSRTSLSWVLLFFVSYSTQAGICDIFSLFIKFSPTSSRFQELKLTPDAILELKDPKKFIQIGLNRTSALKLEKGRYLKGNLESVFTIASNTDSYEVPYSLIGKEIVDTEENLLKYLKAQIIADKNGNGPKLIDWGISKDKYGIHKLRTISENLSDIKQRPEIIASTESINVKDLNRKIDELKNLPSSDRIELKKKVVRDSLIMQMGHPDGHAKNFFSQLIITEDKSYDIRTIAIDFAINLKSKKEIMEIYSKLKNPSIEVIKFSKVDILFSNRELYLFNQYNFYWNRKRLLNGTGLTESDFAPNELEPEFLFKESGP
jgi:hypothetical protein